MKLSFRISILLIAVIGGSCASLRLKPADFAWPVESVINADDRGVITVERYSLSFNVSGLFYEEFKDSSKFKDAEVRILRNSSGYYFLTSMNFKYVYVFETSDGDFVLEDKILVDANGLENPVFNQREPFIELISGELKFLLTEDGIHVDKGEK